MHQVGLIGTHSLHKQRDTLLWYTVELRACVTQVGKTFQLQSRGLRLAFSAPRWLDRPGY